MSSIKQKKLFALSSTDRSVSQSVIVTQCLDVISADSSSAFRAGPLLARVMTEQRQAGQ